MNQWVEHFENTIQSKGANNMKKKTITTATAFGLLMASVPVHAMPVDLNLELEKEAKTSLLRECLV